jgi:hypothetical protein
MTRLVIAPILGVALATACASNPPPVPMVGASEDIANLAGDWTGEYWSVESGRSGSIFFSLTAGTDAAVGDVLMVPVDRSGHDHPEGMHPRSEFIPISFVSVNAGRVSGVLAPYRDPVCGCRLQTTFEGVLKADTIAGTFTSRHGVGGNVQQGRWRVVRDNP